MIVCFQCLKAIESHGEEITSVCHNMDADACTCDWCEYDFEPDALYEIEVSE